MDETYTSLPSGYNPANTINGRAPRAKLIEYLRTSPKFDMIVIGGGIHGAAAAQCAALAELRVLLLERSDFASETSSRSSKMLHGGFRYLQYLDIRQVIEGVRARERYFDIAPHLARPARFLLPVHKASWWHKFPLSIGFGIYDLFIRDKSRSYSWKNVDQCLSTKVPVQKEGLQGAFEFCDGLTNDALLTLETIEAAKDEGAIALNYVGVEHLAPHGNMTAITWRDSLTGEQGKVYAGAVCNTAGPHAPFISGACDREARLSTRYSRGVHLVFSTPWPFPSLLLPMGAFGRYYFVWPHPAGTLVGTTEKECQAPEFDPKPTVQEAEEILQRLSTDLPHSGLNKTTLTHAFCGLRTMVARGEGQTSALSRRHKWVQNGSIFTLLGGKLTTAIWTAMEGIQKILKQSGSNARAPDISRRPLPGANATAYAEEFIAEGAELKVPEEILKNTFARLGGRVRYLMEMRNWHHTYGPVLEGEVRLAFERDQACAVEDIMRRRIGLEFRSDHGIPALVSMSNLLEEYIPKATLAAQVSAYKARMAELDDLLKSVPDLS
jgi:glycerol-3-phosphate dehydrogenase